MNQTVVCFHVFGKRRMQRPCRVCKRRGIRRDTAYYGKKCKIPLCNGDCYRVYHFQKKYYCIVSKRGGIAKQNRTSLIKLSLLFLFLQCFEIDKKDVIPGILG
jgi:hypothetical protein